MKLHSLPLLAASMLVGSAVGAFAYQHSDFSGTWQLDPDRSDFGKAEKPAAMTMSVMKNGKKLMMSQTSAAGVVECTMDTECKSDNRFHPVIGGEGGTVRCKWEGSSLFTERQWNGGDNQEAVRLKMTPDTQTMTQQIHTREGNTVNDMTLFWVRK